MSLYAVTFFINVTTGREIGFSNLKWILPEGLIRTLYLHMPYVAFNCPTSQCIRPNYPIAVEYRLDSESYTHFVFT